MKIFGRTETRPRQAVLALATASAVAAGLVTVTAAGAEPQAPAPQPAQAVRDTDPKNPDFGPNTYIATPSTPAGELQGKLDEIAERQHTNQFGPERDAVLFQPGDYSADVNLGFNTQVAGLGMSPDDVNLNGHVRVEADWLGEGNATQNFWRTAENLSVTPPDGEIERWAVSQAAPYRRMHMRGQMQLWNGYDGWASGGYIADSKIDGLVESGSQQQFLTRNSELAGGWDGSVWNMMFTGTVGAPEQHFPDPSHTNVPETPKLREKPFLNIGEDGGYNVFVPALRENTQGVSWANGAPEGEQISLADFYVAKEGDNAATINAALAEGKHLLFTPGVYHLDDTIKVDNPDTVVLGIGMASLVPDTGKPAVSVADVDGVKLAGLFIDAGEQNSPSLMTLGEEGADQSHAENPTQLSDVFFRIGGPGVGKATNTLTVNSNDVLLDHSWMWRADHGDGVGWDVNTAETGLIVNGDNVTAHGLFVEHYQKNNVVWNGNGGRTYFFQNEFPYDPPDQAAWGGDGGWAAYKVADDVTDHEAWGLGSYCFFDTNPEVTAARSFEVPVNPGVKMHDLVSVSLGGTGTIDKVINDQGDTANGDNQISYVPEYGG
ncbi:MULTISPECIES: sialidase [unclassified Saccharopolyspora]|uniref:sialidase n=1 Tax=unclassified Saccharopolyspora TaxID=2646250 RepID=UPI001CD380CA|nr:MULTISPECIES: sialidase [unclassified Saccharopolyspora]MCA1190502.1 sialidase [Saccharopolyspora sp. 6T]MCA1196131.1 sialidase [Saccharopolyspora sp. 6V]MCA1227198.1 sialidase [Saccharopolyspora sp. 6M]MCA1281897.1 sialidase [Saccharopolyspora sp. 7B]